MKHLFALLILAAAGHALLLGVVRAEDDPGPVIAPRVDAAQANEPDIMAWQAKLSDPDFAHIQATAEALAARHDTKGAALLWTLYNEGDAQRRLLAVRCIGRANVPGQEENLLRAALGEQYQAIRLAAAEELAKVETPDKAATRLLNAALNEKNVPLLARVRALQAVAQVKGKVAADGLKAWLSSPQSEMAAAAAEALGRMGDMNVAEALVAALVTEDAEVKPALIEALENLTGQNYRYDLVQWTQWLKQHPRGAGRVPPPEPAAAERSTDEQSTDEPRIGVRRDGNAPAGAYLNAKAWDVVIVFDTTGSMLHIWPEMDLGLSAVVHELVKQAPSLRLGLVRYRAADPRISANYMVRVQPLTRKHAEVLRDMKDASFGGGSGGLHLGLAYALRTMSWRVTARKMIVLVGDMAPPEDGARACAQAIREAWEFDHLLTNVVYVRSSHGIEQAATYRALSKTGPGHYYEYDKAERRLMDRSNEKADPKPDPELPGVLAAKWLTPLK